MPSNNTIAMCAAGSGKTWKICNSALSKADSSNPGKMILITTFTHEGVGAVRVEMEKQNFGVQSSRIVVRTWFQFLMSELIRPYQSYIVDINKIRSFDFSDRYREINYGCIGEPKRYLSGSDSFVKKDNASELALYLNTTSSNAVIRRLEGVYSHIFIDEVQDMAGCDLDILELLFNSTIPTVCAGDNKQATYSTHNTRTRKSKSGRNFWNFCDSVAKKVEIVKNMESRRFNRSICAFANRVFPNSNCITTNMSEITEHDGVFVIKKSDVQKYGDYFNPVVLKYDKKTDVGSASSYNFGVCKGRTFERVLIYPNNPLKKFLAGTPLSSPEKYYVAATRPKYSLAIVLERLPNIPNFVSATISLEGTPIQALKFIGE